MKNTKNNSTALPNGAKLLKKKKKRGAKIFYWSVLALPLLQFCIFYIGVNVNSLLLSFKEYTVADGFQWLDFGELFANYKQFFVEVANNEVLKYCFENSFVVWLFTVLLITPISILFSYYIYKKRTISGFFKVMLFLPTIIPGIVLVLMYKYFVDGGIPTLLEKWFNVRVLGLLYNPDTAMMMIVIFLMLTGFGTGMLLYTGAMSRIDNSLIESCKLDGANAWREIWHIILPSIYPTITMQMVFGIATFFTSQAALYSFYGIGADPQNYTIGYWLFLKVATDSSSYTEYPYASAAGIAFTLVAAPVTLLVKWAMEKFGPSED